MGWCCFCRSSSSTSTSSFKNIRVVHLNGYVEEHDQPVTVSEVTGKPTKHFVFTHAQLVAAHGSKHLNPETVLEPGHVYFLLPHSAFQSNVSPVDLAPIARKLSAIAKSSRSSCKSKSGRRRLKNVGGADAKWNSGANSPNRFSGRWIMKEPGNNLVGETIVQRFQKSRPWKPILSAIRELSFNRSESDVQEKDLEK